MSSPREPVTTASDNWRGILWAFASMITASAMSVSVRGASGGLDSSLIVAYRAFFTLLILGVLILAMPSVRHNIKFSDPRAHIIRGVLGAVSILMGFYTMAVVPLAAAAILFALAPIFATVFSVALGREVIGLRRGLAILAGFIGAVIVIDPGIDHVEFGMITGLGSSITFGLVLVMSRGMARNDGVVSTLLSTTIVTMVITAPLAWMHFAWPSGFWVMVSLFILVAAGMIRSIADIQAYRFADASVLPPISYLRMVVIGVAAYFLFAEVPTWNTYVGAAIIICATIYITYRERVAKGGV